MIQWIILVMIAIPFMLLGIQFVVYFNKLYQEMLLKLQAERMGMEKEKHQRTLCRVYTHEDAQVPEVIVFLEGLAYNDIVGLVGALEVAKKMCMDSVTSTILDSEESKSHRDLLDN